MSLCIREFDTVSTMVRFVLKWMVLAVVIGVVCFSKCGCQTYDNMTKLRADIFTGYDLDVIPVNNQSAALRVNVTLLLHGVLEVDSVKGVITLVLGAICEWYDERLTWNPADYGGISKFIANIKYVWTPILALGTPIEAKQFAHSWDKVTVFYNGHTYISPGEVLQSSCTMSMKYWPFDKQICQVVFYSPDHTVNELELVSSLTGFINVKLVTNNEWTLEDAKFTTTTAFSTSRLICVLKLKRQSMFYVLTILLPLSGLFLVNILVFYLPQESGERISFSITITLALAVFLTVVAEEMPKSSNPMSLMCVLIAIGVLNSFVILVITTLNMRWYYKDDGTSPRAWHRTLVRISKGQFINKVKGIHPRDSESSKARPCDYKGNTSDNTSKICDKEVTKEGYNDIQLYHKGETTLNTNDTDISWKDVSTAVDVVCFWSFIVVSIIYSLVCNLYIFGTSDYDTSNLIF